VARLSGLATAPEGAWRGDLLMGRPASEWGGSTCIWSRPVIRRYGSDALQTMAMGIGALVADRDFRVARGSLATVAACGAPAMGSSVLYR